MTEIEKGSADNVAHEKRLFEQVFRDLTKDVPVGRPIPPSEPRQPPEFLSESRANEANAKGPEGDGRNHRIKSALRMKYEAEVEQIKKSNGDLEPMRKTLGLSQRKICQLLLVDPSAWSRWTSHKFAAPPHIYRALQWYMLLQEKHPQYKASLWLNTIERPQLSYQEIEKIKREVRPQQLAEDVRRLKLWLKRLIALQICSLCLIGVVLLL